MDFDAARRAAEAYDPVKWREEIQRAYGPAAPGVIEMEEEAGKNASAGRLARIDTMERRWSEISALLRTLPTSDYVADLLSGLGAPCRPEGIGIDRKLLKDTFLYCKEIRARYTILQMMWDLDLLDSISDQVIEEIG